MILLTINQSYQVIIGVIGMNKGEINGCKFRGKIENV